MILLRLIIVLIVTFELLIHVADGQMMPSATQAKLGGLNADNIISDESDGSVFVALNGIIYKYYEDKQLDAIDVAFYSYNDVKAEIINKLLTIVYFNGEKFLISCWQKKNESISSCQINNGTRLMKRRELFWSRENEETLYSQISSKDPILVQVNENNLIIATSRLDSILLKDNSYLIKKDIFHLPKVGIYKLTKRNLSSYEEFVLIEQQHYYSTIQHENYTKYQDNETFISSLYEYIHSFNYKNFTYFVLNNIQLVHDKYGINIKENNLKHRLLRVDLTRSGYRDLDYKSVNSNNNSIITNDHFNNYHHIKPIFVELELPIYYDESVKLASFCFADNESYLTIIFHNRTYLYPKSNYLPSYNTPQLRQVQLYSIGIRYNVYNFTIINDYFNELEAYNSTECHNNTTLLPAYIKSDFDDSNKLICKRKLSKYHFEGFLKVYPQYELLDNGVEGDINFIHSKQQADTFVIFSGAKDGYIYNYFISFLELRKKLVLNKQSNYNHNNTDSNDEHEMSTHSTGQLRTIVQTKNETKYAINGNLLYYVTPIGILNSIDVESCYNYNYCDRCEAFKKPLGCVFCDNICSKEKDCYSRDYSCPVSLKLTTDDTYMIKTVEPNKSLMGIFAFELNGQYCIVEKSKSNDTQLIEKSSNMDMIVCKIGTINYMKTIQFRNNKLKAARLNSSSPQNQNINYKTFEIILFKRIQFIDLEEKIEALVEFVCDSTENILSTIVSCRSVKEKTKLLNRIKNPLASKYNLTIYFIMLTMLIPFIISLSIILVNNRKKSKIEKTNKENFKQNNETRSTQENMELKNVNLFSNLTSISNDYTKQSFYYFLNSVPSEVEPSSDYQLDGENEKLLNDELLSNLIDKNIFIDFSRIKVGCELGKGFFSKVYRGLLKKIDSDNYDDVAIKTMINRNWGNLHERKAFLEEGLIMINFKHENVLELVGVSFDKIGQPLVITPLMLNGDLRSYLQDENFQPTIRILLNFALQVAKGMSYLSNLKFVHRDLAARNCMLDDNLVIKIADFGLSRDIYYCDYVSENKQQPRPLRWLALESLESYKYNSRTDVWAFGILLWEIMSCGFTPYPDVENHCLFQYLKDGHRNIKPKFCPPMVYDIMLECWNENPIERPTFCVLVEQLSQVLDKKNIQLKKDLLLKDEN